MSPMEQLLSPLTPEERDEFEAATSYLTEMSGRGRIPEGSMAGILNSLSPAVREVFDTIQQLQDNPRLMPYQPKIAVGEYDQMLGFDPATAGVVRQRLEDESITAGLQERMGVTQPSNEPPTRRELVEAAFNKHAGGK